MVSLTIDGIDIKVEKGTTLLEAAKKIAVRIPTLCHHEALTPYGGCRLCIVEVKQGDIKQIVSSCSYEAEEGIIVKTGTEKVLALRRFLVELLLAEAPQAKVLQDLAEELGITVPKRFKPRNELCIACGQCIRACQELVEVSAIDFARRGYERIAASPFFRKSDVCIGCGTCFAICPTGAITMIDVKEGEAGIVPEEGKIQGPARIMENWKAGFEMKRCKECGEAFAPTFQLDYFKKKVNLPEDFYDVCMQCRPS